MGADLRAAALPCCRRPVGSLLCSWEQFAAGFTVGGLSGVAWSYILTQVLPYYS